MQQQQPAYVAALSKADPQMSEHVANPARIHPYRRGAPCQGEDPDDYAMRRHTGPPPMACAPSPTVPVLWALRSRR